jgi:hypothetical protein
VYNGCVIERSAPQNSLSHRRPARLIPLLAGSVALLILGLNSAQVFREIQAIYRVKKVIPYAFPGHKFLGLEAIFKDVAYAGYYTDKNLDDFEHGAQFAQAQLMLVPTILELNNLGHEYTLFDCTSPEIAYQKIREAGLIPMKKNQFGIVLAKRKK